MGAEEDFEEALSNLVGDNVGQNCECPECVNNRNIMRRRVEALIEERLNSQIEAQVKE